MILVAILWIAVLVPGVISKLSEHRSAGSIGRFHRRLDLLERTGPKLVKPAYRLTGTDAVKSSTPLVVPVAPPPVRPNLRLVPSPEEGASATFEAEYEEPTGVIDISDVVEQMRASQDHEYLDEGVEDCADEYEEAYVEPGNERLHHLVALGDRIDAEVGGEERRGSAAFERRQQARRRRRNCFGALCGLAALTGLLGLARPLRGAWVVSAILLVLLVGFVGLAANGQRIEAERRHLAKLQLTERAREPEREHESAVVKYLSSEELSEYRAALAGYYEAEDSRLVEGARALG